MSRTKPKPIDDPEASSPEEDDPMNTDEEDDEVNPLMKRPRRKPKPKGRQCESES